MIPRASRTIRLAGILLAMSVVCAASGILLDYRVMDLLEMARDGMLHPAELDRADEVATILFLLTLGVNGSCVLAMVAWMLRARVSGLPSLLLLGILLIPLANPVLPFLARASPNGPMFGIASRVVGVMLAAVLLWVVRQSRPGAADERRAADTLAP